MCHFRVLARNKFATNVEVKRSLTSRLQTLGTPEQNPWCHGGSLFNVAGKQLEV
jgi:hypothetical protein